jgi:hypothetical protein
VLHDVADQDPVDQLRRGHALSEDGPGARELLVAEPAYHGRRIGAALAQESEGLGLGRVRVLLGVLRFMLWIMPQDTGGSASPSAIFRASPAITPWLKPTWCATTPTGHCSAVVVRRQLASEHASTNAISSLLTCSSRVASSMLFCPMLSPPLSPGRPHYVTQPHGRHEARPLSEQAAPTGPLESLTTRRKAAPCRACASRRPVI